jgi:Ca2+-binding RTX toxin-like protein
MKGAITMRRVALVVSGALALVVTQLLGPAAAQDEPLCGPPGEEVPATIVGSGVIIGTSGDDVIVGSDENDTILGLDGDDVICGQGGNDGVLGGNGNDTPHR